MGVAYAWFMSTVELEQLLREAEALLAVNGELPAPAAKAVGMLSKRFAAIGRNCLNKSSG